MKICRPTESSGSARGRARQAEHGMAIIVVLLLVSIILLYLAASARTLHLLGRDLKLVERRQVQRLASAGNGTNTITATNMPTASSGTQVHGPDNRH